MTGMVMVIRMLDIEVMVWKRLADFGGEVRIVSFPLS